MKRRSLLSILVAVLLTTTLLLSSCGEIDHVDSYYDIFSENMPFGSATYGSNYVAFPELDGFVIDHYLDEDGVTKIELVSEEFAVFVKMNDSGVLTHKVLSLRSHKVVGTFAAQNTVHEFRLVENAPAFFLKTTVIDPSIDTLLGLDNVVDVTYSMYDAAGNCVVTSDNEEMPYELADLLIYDYAAYSYDLDGIITKVIDVPEYLLLENCFDWNDTYLYVDDTHNGYTVYDRNFNSVSYWCAPGYDMDGCDMFVLNSKDVLVQYKIIMDDDAEDFDYVINNDDYQNLKIDLETFIVDVETGEAEELEDFEYVVGGVISRESMIRESEEENAEEFFKFENLITLTPINQLHLDDSHASIDLVMMSDDGKLEKSVKFTSYQNADIPTRISEDRFTVGMLTGQMAIIEENGNILHKLDKYYRIVDRYIVGTQAIYDFDLNKVYDLRANDGDVIGIIYNTVYIMLDTDAGYDIVAFNGGETKTIYTFNASAPSGIIFELYEEARCYMLYNGASGEFTYYNSVDEVITNSTKKLGLRHASEMHMTYLMWTPEEPTPSYCVFVSVATDVE